MARKDYLGWDEYFMEIALLSAQRSKDPVTQVGACIVNDDKKIVSIGYNGFPVGCDDDKLPWTKNGEIIDTKYPYVCHAELNAISNKNDMSLKDTILYVTLFPCNECAKLIIQFGIKKVVYISNKNADTWSAQASKKMLDLSGVEYVQYMPTREIIYREIIDN